MFRDTRRTEGSRGARKRDRKPPSCLWGCAPERRDPAAAGDANGVQLSFRQSLCSLFQVPCASANRTTGRLMNLCFRDGRNITAVDAGCLHRPLQIFLADRLCVPRIPSTALTGRIAPARPCQAAASPACDRDRAPVRAENPVRGSDQQSCPSRAPAVMITHHVPAVHVPPDHAASRVSAASPA